MKMTEALIIDAVRTPFGKREGSLRDTHPQDLAAQPLRALEMRNGFDPSLIEDVTMGCAKPVFEQGSNIGRFAPMVAGWGDGVPGFQLDRLCGSGQQAINLAAANIRAGFQDVIVAGGTEHMTRVPITANRSGPTPVDDMADTYFEHFEEMTHQGEAAERIAEKWGLSRSDVDEIAVDSQRRWKRAHDEGRFDSQLVPVETKLDGAPYTLERDEHPRPDTDLETLSNLPPAFRDEGKGVIHPGNSSGIVDGASAALVASEEAVDEQGWEPMARVVQTAVVGVDPILMLTGPIPATEKVLKKANMSADDIDLFEINEAFAPVVNAWLEETGIPWEKTNVNGGAIAHGHPLGATGAALITKLAHELERTGSDTALSTMCIGHGQAVATIIERV
jgi:acetyl-CoA C-acetyltransferase